MTGRTSSGRSARPATARRFDAAARELPLPRAEELAHLPVVALVGRPNTGKSTLFNRLTRSRRAVVASTPGVTRDRNVAVAIHGGRRFVLFDTGGFEVEEHEDLRKAIQMQGLLAAEEADAVVVVLDGRAGLSALDSALVERLRSLSKPLYAAVNKIDSPAQRNLQSDFCALGIDELHAISAEHGVNVDDLIDAVLAALPAHEMPVFSGDPPTSVAIIGRPNVGKSSLLNRLVGYDRAIVAATPGTTRDALDTPVSRGESAYLLVDTAGVRRRPKVHQHVERASAVRALRALERAEAGLLLVDGVEGMTEQDARLAGYAWERGRALVLLVNKWDAVPHDGRDRGKVAREIDRCFPSLSVVPKLFVSALTGGGVNRIWAAIDAVVRNHRVRVPTAALNQVLGRAVRQQPPPVVKGKRARFFYATQTATAPPTITIFVSAPGGVPATYERYLANQMRNEFGIEGSPLRLRFRSRRPPRKG